MKKVGVGTRALNFLVDTIIVWLLTYAAFTTWNWYVVYWQYPYHNFWLFFAGVVLVYYTLFESLFGRTPGKWVSFSKVVNKKGGKPGLFLVLLRSIVRITIIDLFFFPFLDKTLHDYVSGTEVVEV